MEPKIKGNLVTRSKRFEQTCDKAQNRASLVNGVSPNTHTKWWTRVGENVLKLI